MSVIRYPSDGNVSQGLGALGDALGTMFNPKLKWEAYELQQRILAQRLQMQELQRKFGARDDLKREYLTNPLFRQLPQEWFNYAIEGGISAPDLMKEAALYAQAHGDASIGTAILGQQAPWKEVYAPIVDQQSLANAQATIARQKENEAAAAAAGTLIGGGQTLEPGKTLVRPGAPFAPIQFNGQNMTFGATPGTTSGAATQSSGPSVPPVSPAARAAPASSGAVTQANSGAAGAVTQPGGATVNYDPNTNVSAITGPSPVDIERQKDVGNRYRTLVSTDAAGRNGATKMLNVIAEIQQLQKLSQTGGLSGQGWALASNILSEHGLHLWQGASAQEAIDALLKQTMPAIIKEDNMTRFAKPEIDFARMATGSGQMPPELLNKILSNYAAAAQVELDNANLATNIQARGSLPEDMYDFYTKRALNENKIADYTTQIGNDMKALGSPAQQTQSNAPETVFGTFPTAPNLANAPPIAPPQGAPVSAPPQPLTQQAPPQPLTQQAPPPQAPAQAGGADFMWSGGKLVPLNQ